MQTHHPLKALTVRIAFIAAAIATFLALTGPRLDKSPMSVDGRDALIIRQHHALSGTDIDYSIIPSPIGYTLNYAGQIAPGGKISLGIEGEGDRHDRTVRLNEGGALHLSPGKYTLVLLIEAAGNSSMKTSAVELR